MIRKVVQLVSRGQYSVTTFWLPKVTRFKTVRQLYPPGGCGQPAARAHGSVLSISLVRIPRRDRWPSADCEGGELPGREHPVYSLPHNAFALALRDQGFEHIDESPEATMAECLRVHKPGGELVLTTCFLIPNHGPEDYWRFWPEGLEHLCHSLTRINEASGTGNPLFPHLTGLGFTHLRVPRWLWHPLTWIARFRSSSCDYIVWEAAEK